MHTALPPIVNAALPDILDACPAGVLVEDAAGRVLWANPAFAAQLGIDHGTIAGREAATLPLEPMAPPPGVELLYRVLDADGEPGGCLACSRWPRDGSRTAEGLRVQFFTDAPRHRRLAGAGGSALLALLRSRTGTDPASGVLDQRSVSQVLRSEVSRSRRYGNTLSVALLAVPGDGADAEHMARAGRVLQEQTRWADSVGRWGDTQFLLVLPETAAEAAEALMSKLESAGEAGQVTFRYGIAQWQTGDDVSFLVDRAREALGPVTQPAPRESRNHG